jgi:hypothetical protein
MSLASCCGYLLLIGVFFFLVLTMMAWNRNEVFLMHKAQGMDKAPETTWLLVQVTIVRFHNY